MIAGMADANVFDNEFEYDQEDPKGYRAGLARVGQAAGGDELAVKLMELPPGESVCPYHYEYVEEWLVVLDGTVDVRRPDGVHSHGPGDVVRFAPGPDGAHKVGNSGDVGAHVLMFSSGREPSVSVYPDGDKIGVWVPGGADNVMLRREDGNREYYDGEV
jgi:uncharacterized cupin superfamily protein